MNRPFQNPYSRLLLLFISNFLSVDLISKSSSSYTYYSQYSFFAYFQKWSIYFQSFFFFFFFLFYSLYFNLDRVFVVFYFLPSAFIFFLFPLSLFAILDFVCLACLSVCLSVYFGLYACVEPEVRSFHKKASTHTHTHTAYENCSSSNLISLKLPLFFGLLANFIEHIQGRTPFKNVCLSNMTFRMLHQCKCRF